jgi:tetratricopeptide (TPR) repeat protein
LQIYTELEDERGQSMALNSLGILNQEARRYTEARRCFERSLELKRKIGHRRAIYITMHNLSTLDAALGYYDQARSREAEVLQFSQEIGDKEALGDSHLLLGGDDLEIGLLHSARSHLETALTFYHEMGSLLGECLVRLRLGELFLRQGDPAATLEQTGNILALADPTDLPREHALARGLSAASYLAMDDFPNALTSYQQALQTFRALADHTGLVVTLAGIARAHLDAGDLPSAIAAADEILHRLTASAENSHLDPTDGPDRLNPSPAAPPLEDFLYTSLDITGLDSPFLIVQTCLEILIRADDPRAARLYNAARSLLLEWASRLESDEDRAVYLGLPHHQALLAPLSGDTAPA